MSDRRKAWFLLVALAMLAGVTIALIDGNRPQPRANRGQVAKIADPKNEDAKPGRFPFEREFEPGSIESIVGVTQPIPMDANPMTQSVGEAVLKGGHPERLSPLIVPAKFDPQAYRADPQKYLNTVEPGRIWQPAQPGPDVPRVEAASKGRTEVLQGEWVTLKVKAIPDAPVTFSSFDLGAFSNQLTSVTVAADKDGVASAQFVGTPGTYNEVRIMAASPVTSGQVNFEVTVVVPKLRELQAKQQLN